MYFYKIGDNWEICGNALVTPAGIPSGTCIRREEGATHITISNIYTREVYFDKADVREIQKNTDGDTYSSITDFKAATSGFFVDAALAAAEQLEVDLGVEVQNRTSEDINLQNQINTVVSGYLGAIAYNAAAPTPAKNGWYDFSTGGVVSWLTGAPTVKIGDRVSVLYAAPSTYSYKAIIIDSQTFVQKSELDGQTLNYKTTADIGVLADKAYAGSTLGSNPVAYPTASALNRIDVSLLPTGTHIYILSSAGANIYDGATFKFFNSSGVQLTSTVIGTTNVDRGYSLPTGATILGIHINESSFSLAQVETFLIYGLITDVVGLKERITANELAVAEIPGLKNDIEDLTTEVESYSGAIENINNEIFDIVVNETTFPDIGVLENSAFVGSTLANNPVANSTYSALNLIDVSAIPDGTRLYVLSATGVNIFDGLAFKFFNSSGVVLANIVNGTAGVDRGYLKPVGAVSLGLNIGESSWTFAQCADFRFVNLPKITKNIKTKVTENIAEILTLKSRVSDLETSIDYSKILKILFIGSSFGVDTISRVGEICNSYGFPVVLGNCYVGAGSVKGYLSRIANNQGITYYKWNYTFQKMLDWIQIGAADSVLVDYCLNDEVWDYIIIQNGAYQGDTESEFWEKDGEGNITTNYYQNLVDYCKKHNKLSNPVFGANMTWAFSQYHTTPAGHEDDNWDSFGATGIEKQLEMYARIIANYSQVVDNCPDIKFLIPTGTAIQNARNTDLENQTTTPGVITGTLDEWTNKNDMTRDSIHCDFGVGRYIASGTLFQTVIAKRINKSFLGNTLRLPFDGMNMRAQLATEVTDLNVGLCQQAVLDAINNPFGITQII